MGLTVDEVKDRLTADRDRWERCLKEPDEVFLPYCEMKGHHPPEFRAFIMGLWQGAEHMVRWLAEEEGAEILEGFDEQQFGHSRDCR